MKYFLDTEFIEGFHKPLFGKRRHHIDLISIGIVAEDGREYHAISNEYNYKDADDWVKDNVILPLYRSTVHGFAKNHIGPERFHHHYGKSNKQIMYEVIQFVCSTEKASEYAGVGSLQDGLEGYLSMNPPEFYGYYADYDWVLFCSLFGRMIDLPKGFPMYCRDLKQMLDEAIKKYAPEGDMSPGSILYDCFRIYAGYPKSPDSHLAIDDAKWNKQLYNALIALK